MKEPSPVIIENTRKLLDPEKALILVGFGKKDLAELIEMFKSDQADQAIRYCRHAPPRWRRLAICDPQDVENMKTYVELLSEKLSGQLPGL